jgi:hypothetical protein
MKKLLLLIIGIIYLFTTSCVQKTTKQTVIFHLDVKGIKGIKNVGIRGNDKPLSWDYDYEMKMGKDSIYTATISGETGYAFTEIKFTINGDYELKDKPNRRIVFSKSGVANYYAVFNKYQ